MSDTQPGAIDGQSSIELPDLDPVSVPTPDEKPKRTRRPRAASADTKPKQPRGTARRPALEARLTENLVTVGTFVCVIDQVDGLAIVNGAPNLAASLAKAAEANPKVRDGLEKMLSAGVWSGVVGSLAAIAIPIMANHKMLPASLAAGLFGAPPGEAAPGAA